jgi:hypothetical protein
MAQLVKDNIASGSYMCPIFRSCSGTQPVSIATDIASIALFSFNIISGLSYLFQEVRHSSSRVPTVYVQSVSQSAGIIRNCLSKPV